ncbi:uncharacterized protein N7459_009853 [Penicillium hispanicum]|uniref:uncharacterized protein n=1 Tax=Penicillium hispanicum TaxID=1080232 RepID=UPI002540F9FF|nr:uncharacterized protein N7459_009853 [Penicillium hispanicum]KAJ5570423.1 hypothetical protein N7459_009853 [Penicillium hispanicum]
MARFSLSFFALFLVLAALALSLPTKRDDVNTGKPLGLETALDDLKDVSKMIQGPDNDDTNQKNQLDKADPSTHGASEGSKDETKGGEPTRTHKKPSSGNFVTPTATTTHHPTSKPNMLGNLPVVGSLLGGTGGSL